MSPETKDKMLAVYTRFVVDLCNVSKCEDKHTAAIAVSNDLQQVYSIGINGGPKGGADCLCSHGGKYTCIHSEANCIAKCTATDKDKIMICSFSPCVTCASLITNSGFKHVYYIEAYKDLTGIGILLRAGIGVTQITKEVAK